MSRDKKRMGASALLGCRLTTEPPRGWGCSAAASPQDSGLVGRSAPWVVVVEGGGEDGWEEQQGCPPCYVGFGGDGGNDCGGGEQYQAPDAAWQV